MALGKKKMLHQAAGGDVNTDNFAPVLYTGNGSTQPITTVGFQPDFVWIKNRDQNDSHQLFDSVRGAGFDIHSDTTAAEPTSADTTSLTSFDTNGFTLSTNVVVNTNNEDYVAWCWKAGGTAVSNTDGSITSQVSANTDAGFSIVSYTGNFTASTVGHGLSAAPEMVIVKNRDSATNWWVWHTGLGDGTKYLKLNGTDAVNSVSSIWNSTVPTTTVFSIGNDGGSNGSGNDIIAYCFHSTDYQKVGSYTGNGSTSGPTITTGFEPRFLLIKEIDNPNPWFILDSLRDTTNPRSAALIANSSAAEDNDTTNYKVNFNSDNFQIVTSYHGFNRDESNYIYLAIA